jgi:hypothetical protein
MSIRRTSLYRVLYLGLAAVVLGCATGAQAKPTRPAFRKVPFSILVRHQSSGVYTTSSVSFPYVLTKRGITPTAEGEQEPVITLLSVAHNHCRSVHVDFLFGRSQADAEEYAALTGTTGTVSVVQQNRAPATSTMGFESQGSIDTKLVPGQTWSITASAGKPAGSRAGVVEVFVNGYAICNSTEKV